MILSIIILSIWLFFSVINQFGFDIVSKFDFLQVLPNWRFFAPNPVKHDYYLFYRQKLKNLSITNWQQDRRFEENIAIPFFWNPQRRNDKIFYDLIQSFGSLKKIEKSELIKLSIPYLALIHHVSNLTFFTDALEYQCMIMSSENKGYKIKNEAIFITDFHPIS